MKDLIKRLEKATEGSREFDALVWAGVCSTEDFDFPPPASGWELRFEPCDDGSVTLYAVNSRTEQWSKQDRRAAPHYTTSLDAALTLVPEGAYWEIWCGKAPLKFSRVIADPQGSRFGAVSRAKDPALALCIAALRARSQS